jgi:hypothetical protein
MEDDDFTFPTVAAARGPTAPLGRPDDEDPVPHLLQLPPPPSPTLAGTTSPLWPFAGSTPKTTTTTAAPPSSPPVTEEDDEDRMDLLWESTLTTRPVATAPAPAPESAGSAVVSPHAGPPPERRAAAADDKQRAAALAAAERMDRLWESFNEDLVVLRRHVRDRGRRSKSAAEHPGGTNTNTKAPRALADDDDDDHWYLCNYSASSGADDDESDGQETSASSPAERRGYGCAPTRLRASSRAGGAGQFCGAGASHRGRRRGRGGGAAAGWALLLRLFRRLFAVDRTAQPSRSVCVP